MPTNSNSELTNAAIPFSSRVGAKPGLYSFHISTIPDLMMLFKQNCYLRGFRQLIEPSSRRVPHDTLVDNRKEINLKSTVIRYKVSKNAFQRSFFVPVIWAS